MIARTPMAGPGASAVPAHMIPPAANKTLSFCRIIFSPLLTCHSYQHLAHRTFGQPREGLLHVFKCEYMVHDRLLPAGVQPSRDLVPRRLCLLGREIGHCNSSDAIAPEEERRGIEARYLAAASAHHADAPAESQHRDHLIEERAAHAVHHDIHFPGRKSSHGSFAQVWVRGIEHEVS